jgi:hypothetical protein
MQYCTYKCNITKMKPPARRSVSLRRVKSKRERLQQEGVL